MKKLSLILLALIALTQGAWAQDVNYIECSWTGSDTGGSVVSTEKTATGVTSWNGTDNLGGGWYYFSGTKENKDSRITVSGNVSLILVDGCQLTLKKGIQIQDGCTLTIYAQSGGTGKLKCTGSSGENGAIGGNNRSVGGHLVIHGGDIYAKPSSNNAAGIGGGEGDSDHATGMQSVTIYGGTIEAIGKSSGAGIGCGEKNSNPPDVTIYGGDITANGGKYGAGIGGSEDCANGTIKIYGGTIHAKGKTDGSGIGTGYKSDMVNPVYIYGGDITAEGGGCGIGSCDDNNTSSIYIYGGTINATSGSSCAAIGGSLTPVYIYGGTVNAESTGNGAAIGGNNHNSNGPIKIYGGTITTTTVDYKYSGAGIGAGCDATMENPVTIYGGIIHTTSHSGAGIGGGGAEDYDEISSASRCHNNSTIRIYGGEVYARSKSYSAAIGGGCQGGGGTIRIYGGYVEATAENYGAGIGGGRFYGDQFSCGGTIYIYGGTVKAQADDYNECHAIGGVGDQGEYCDGDLILGTTMKVYTSSNNTTVASNNRVDACRANSGYVLVSECEHSFTYSEYDYQHHFRSTCPYCNISSDYDFHTYGSDGHTCTLCGFNATDPKTLTFYEANAGGTGYEVTTTETHQNLTKCKLPSYTNVPSRLAFEGWVKVDEAPGDNEALTVVTDEQAASMTIYEAGQTYEVKADSIFKAVYKNGWSGEGSGSEADPYIISTIADFNQLASITASCYYYDGKYFRMDADLDFTGESFTPVGNSTKPFKGILDGEGHSISGINVETADTYKALFGIVHGTVKNLTLTNSTFKANTNVGGIVCENWGTIENCHVTSSVSIEYYSGNGGNFGGIVGSNNGTVDGCTSAATVDGKTKGKVGGIVGYNEGTLKNSLYYGNNVTDGEYVGAIVGWEHTSDGTLTSNYYVPWTDGPAAVVNMGSSSSQDVSGAKAGYTVTSGTNGLTLYFGEATIYEYGGVKVYDFGLSYDGVLYSGNGQQVTFTPQARGYLVSDIQANGTALSPNSDGSYTITMGTANVSITAGALTPAVTRIVDGYGNGNDKWAFIASPMASDIAPSSVSGLIATPAQNYDLYQLNNTTWENWKVGDGQNAHPGFDLKNGTGYLYASKQRTELVFVGTFNEGTTMTVPLSEGWNLVGNPFTDVAYVNRPFYQMNDDGSAIVAIENYNSYTPTDIPACTGIIVDGTNGNVTFSTTEPEQAQAPNNGSLYITLSQVDAGHGTTGRGTAGTMLDNAIITFNEGSQLGKFYFGKQSANIYLPQGNKEYAIACISTGTDVARNVSTTNEVPINFKAKKDGTYTISVSPEGVEMAYLHLIDNMTGADVDLLSGDCGSSPAMTTPSYTTTNPEAVIAGMDPRSPAPSYTFTAKTTDYASRFRLVFSTKGDGPSTGSGTEEAFAFIDASGNIIITDGPSTGSGTSGTEGSGTSTLQIVDMTGRVIRVCTDVARNVSTSGMVPGVYVLRLINGDVIRTQKMVIQTQP